MSSRLRLFLVFGLNYGSRPSAAVRRAFDATGGGEDDQGATLTVVESAQGAVHYVLQATASTLRLLNRDENPVTPVVPVPDGANPLHGTYVEALEGFCARHGLPRPTADLGWLVTAEHG